VSEALAAMTDEDAVKELANAGLASQQREGRYLIYRAAYERMNALLGYLTDHCCQGGECLATPAVSCDPSTGPGKGERISIDNRLIRSGN